MVIARQMYVHTYGVSVGCTDTKYVTDSLVFMCTCLVVVNVVCLDHGVLNYLDLLTRTLCATDYLRDR